jgi:hypothetical protein
LPLSQPVIAIANNYFYLPVHRVVDYSDLLAIFVLPFVAQIKPKSLHLPMTGVYCVRWIVGFVTFFSLCSTSVYRPLFQAHPAIDDIYFNESFTAKRSAVAVLQALREKGITYRRDSVMYYPITNQQQLYYRLPIKSDSVFAWQQVSQKPDSTLYVRWEGMPYYLIPFYQSGTRTIRNIRFSLSENKNATKSKITIQMFHADGVSRYMHWDRKTRNAYKEIFEKLFSAQ